MPPKKTVKKINSKPLAPLPFDGKTHLTEDERSRAKDRMLTAGDGSIGRDINYMIQSRFKILYVRSFEERRVVDFFKDLAVYRGADLFRWDCDRGLLNAETRKPVVTEDSEVHESPIAMLAHIVDHASKQSKVIVDKKKQPEESIYMLLDFHPFLDGVPQVERKLKEIAGIISSTVVIIVAPTFVCPPTLEKDVTLVDFPVPSYKEIKSSLLKIGREISNKLPHAYKQAKENEEDLVKAATGLTLNEAENAYAMTIVKDRKFNIQTILDEKKQMIRKGGILEYRDSRFTMDDLGGLDTLKEWLILRRLAFKEDARQFGLPAPKGLLLLGIPGTGKSATCDALADLYKMPLLRLDFGAIFASHVGESIHPDETVILFNEQESFRGSISEAFGKHGSIPKKQFWTYSFNADGVSQISKVNKIIRHESCHDREMYLFRTEGGNRIRVTGDHSLFSLGQQGEMETCLAKNIQKGDYLATVHSLPEREFLRTFAYRIDLLYLISEQKFEDEWVVTNCQKIMEDIPANRYKNEMPWYYSHKSTGREVLSKYLEWCKVAKIKPSDDIMISPKFARKNRKSHSVSRFFEADDSLAFTVGLWMGDGCEGDVFRIAAHQKEVGTILSNCFAELTEYKCSENGSDLQGRRIWNDIRLLLGIQGRDNVRRIPSWVFQMDDAFICFLLRGYIFADGHFSDQGCEISSVSRFLIDDVCFLLLRLHINCTVSSRLNSCGNEEYRITIKDKISLKSITNICNQESHKHEMHSQRKFPLIDGVKEELRMISRIAYKKGIRVSFNLHQKFVMEANIVNILDILKISREQVPIIDKLINSSVWWKCVNQIEQIPATEYVYDLSIEDNHNFISGLGSFIAHNSEANIRQCLQVAEAISPAILWVDEVEKGIGGVESSNSTDGGVTNRVFGTMLTWMQDKESPVFVVCTANNIAGIPPEFMRAGRFDEIFFIDLPTAEQREEVIEKLLSRKGRQPSDFNINAIVSASVNYTPVEIEKGIDNALFVSYADNKRKVTTEDVVLALSSFYPLYNSRREDVQRMRKWALGENGQGGRAILANSPSKTTEVVPSSEPNEESGEEVSEIGRLIDLDF